MNIFEGHRGILALRVPFPWVPVPITLTWTLGPMADYFGAWGALYSVRNFPKLRSQLVQSILHLAKGFVLLFNTNNKTVILLVNFNQPAN